MPLAGIIDLDAERARLEQGARQGGKEIAKIEAKLGNEQFMAKAPEEVIEEQRERLAEATPAARAHRCRAGAAGGLTPPRRDSLVQSGARRRYDRPMTAAASPFRVLCATLALSRRSGGRSGARRLGGGAGRDGRPGDRDPPGSRGGLRLRPAARWFRLSLCDDQPLCLTPGQPPEPLAAPDGIPGGTIAYADGEGITSAWYSEPTDRYPHGALGDKIEAGALVVQDVYGHRVTVTLPADQVFEDLTPRIADLDGDGRNEVLAIRSSLRAGAALVAYDLAGSSLIEIDSTPPIGLPNRWLNVAGIADFTGDRSLDIAAVRTPHIGGTLDIVTLDRRRFRTIASAKGFSNHRLRLHRAGHVGRSPASTTTTSPIWRCRMRTAACCA